MRDWVKKLRRNSDDKEEKDMEQKQQEEKKEEVQQQQDPDPKPQAPKQESQADTESVTDTDIDTDSEKQSQRQDSRASSYMSLDFGRSDTEGIQSSSSHRPCTSGSGSSRAVSGAGPYGDWLHEPLELEDEEDVDDVRAHSPTPSVTSATSSRSSRSRTSSRSSVRSKALAGFSFREEDSDNEGEPTESALLAAAGLRGDTDLARVVGVPGEALYELTRVLEYLPK